MGWRALKNLQNNVVVYVKTTDMMSIDLSCATLATQQPKSKGATHMNDNTRQTERVIEAAEAEEDEETEGETNMRKLKQKQ